MCASIIAPQTKQAHAIVLSINHYTTLNVPSSNGTPLTHGLLILHRAATVTMTTHAVTTTAKTTTTPIMMRLGLPWSAGGGWLVGGRTATTDGWSAMVEPSVRKLIGGTELAGVVNPLSMSAEQESKLMYLHVNV